jgi:hypothetical protein
MFGQLISVWVNPTEGVASSQLRGGNIHEIALHQGSDDRTAGMTGVGAWIGAQHHRDIQRARVRIATGSHTVTTRCGAIEHATAEEGPALLLIRGAGGGFDHGLLLRVTWRFTRCRWCGQRLSKALDPLTVPTLIISARDNLYGPWESVQLIVDNVPQAHFIGYPFGGPMLVNHADEVRAAIVHFLEEAGAEPGRS